MGRPFRSNQKVQEDIAYVSAIFLDCSRPYFPLDLIKWDRSVFPTNGWLPCLLVLDCEVAGPATDLTIRSFPAANFGWTETIVPLFAISSNSLVLGGKPCGLG